jgi:hypothetical protein
MKLFVDTFIYITSVFQTVIIYSHQAACFEILHIKRKYEQQSKKYISNMSKYEKPQMALKLCMVHSKTPKMAPHTDYIHKLLAVHIR